MRHSPTYIVHAADCGNAHVATEAVKPTELRDRESEPLSRSLVSTNAARTLHTRLMYCLLSSHQNALCVRFFFCFFLHNKFTYTRFVHLSRLHFSSFIIIALSLLVESITATASRSLTDVCTYTQRASVYRRINYNFQNFAITYSAEVHTPSVCCHSVCECVPFSVRTQFRRK